MIFFFFKKKKDLLYIPGQPEALYIDQASLEFTDTHFPVSQVLGLKAYNTMSSIELTFLVGFKPESPCADIKVEILLHAASPFPPATPWLHRPASPHPVQGCHFLKQTHKDNSGSVTKHFLLSVSYYTVKKKEMSLGLTVVLLMREKYTHL